MPEKRYFEKGDIIMFSDKEFVVLENYGCFGKVRENYPNGTTINKFYWDYNGGRSELKPY